MQTFKMSMFRHKHLKGLKFANWDPALIKTNQRSQSLELIKIFAYMYFNKLKSACQANKAKARPTSTISD